MSDNIVLNIHNIKKNPKKPKKERVLSVTSKVMKRAANNSSEASFQFTTDKLKVKALVMRKRAVTTAKATESQPNNEAEPKPKKIKQAILAEKPSNPSMMPKPKAKAISKQVEIPAATRNLSTNAGNDDFTFNIDIKPVIPKAPAKSVSTKNETKVVASGISKRQLKEALGGKKRLENPNKQPRAGDLFKAQMDEEYKKKRAAEQPTHEEKQSEDEAQQSKTNGTHWDEASDAEQSEQKGNEDADSEAESEMANKVTKAKPNKQKAETKSTPAESRARVKKIGLFDKSDLVALKELGQRAVKPIKETIFTQTKMETQKLHPHLVKNLKELLGITLLTTVQEKSLPHMLAGKNVMVRSQTGSGKTLAYALPMVQRMQAQEPHIQRTDGILALIVVPTHELALQTLELFNKLLKPFNWIVPGAFVGGEKRKNEKVRLRRGINVLLGTPGRLVDHLLHTESFKLNKLQFLVIDEADRMLELGYERDVKQLVEAIAKQRSENTEESPKALQSMLLSATLTSQVQQLAGLALKEPVYIDNSDEAAGAALKHGNGYDKHIIEAQQQESLGEYLEDITGVLTIPENLQLSYLVVPPKLRLCTLSALLATELAAQPTKFKAIVFMATTEMVNLHSDMLNEVLTSRVLDDDDEQDAELDSNQDAPLLKGLRFFKLHGSMTQTERSGVFQSFRKCNSCVLLTTDISGRGIDVPDVSFVIQYTPPHTTADFVHRVGRTARAGRRGRAVLFLAPSEAKFVRRLEDKRIRIAQGDMYKYLDALLKCDNEAHTVQEAASNLQHKFQSLVEGDRELRDHSKSAFASWLKFYQTFPKELKEIFNKQCAHMGHFAKSFGLNEAPSKFLKNYAAPKEAPPTNRLTYTERDPEKVKQGKREKRRLFTTTVSGEAGRQRQPQQQQQAERQTGSGHFMKKLNKSRALLMSEFDSGLPALSAPKKRKLV
ncbi:CG8611 [Drosophila busckii]|uniref:ATP-dependent RNA helicase n=2 Tax=Drosophila busckii TaxID=30019 RepID=A0A0M3QZS8_DROBS|nr:CG8611 [Drosophila busckii]